MCLISPCRKRDPAASGRATLLHSAAERGSALIHPGFGSDSVGLSGPDQSLGSELGLNFASLLAEQTSEVVLHHGALLAALLKEEAGNGGLHEAVLVPVRMLVNENAHRTVQILR